MKKYIKILQNRLAAGLEYRADMVGTLVLDLISLVSILILWTAIFSGQKQVGNFNFNESILYFSLNPLIGAFTYVFISEDLGYEIKRGALSNYLLKPFKLYIDAFCRAVASKINYFFVGFPVYFLIFILFATKLGHSGIGPITVLLFFVSIVFGFLLHFLIDLSLCWWAFWIGDIWAFKHLKRILFLAFGGISFPINIVSGRLRSIIELLPFKYMYYIPNTYLLGKREIYNLPIDILGIIIWSLIFILINNILWSSGVKKYEAYGG